MSVKKMKKMMNVKPFLYSVVYSVFILECLLNAEGKVLGICRLLIIIDSFSLCYQSADSTGGSR